MLAQARGWCKHPLEFLPSWYVNKILVAPLDAKKLCSTDGRVPSEQIQDSVRTYWTNQLALEVFLDSKLDSQSATGYTSFSHPCVMPFSNVTKQEGLCYTSLLLVLERTVIYKCSQSALCSGVTAYNKGSTTIST